MKKIVICVLLVLLIGTVAVSVLGMQNRIDKIVTGDSEDSGAVSTPEVEDPDNTDVAEYGYKISFSESFFDCLNAVRLDMFIDGKQITERPKDGHLRGSVIEFVCNDEFDKEQDYAYRMNVNPESAFVAYSDRLSEGFYNTGEFYMPIALVLRDNIFLDSIEFK